MIQPSVGRTLPSKSLNQHLAQNLGVVSVVMIAHGTILRAHVPLPFSTSTARCSLYHSGMPQASTGIIHAGRGGLRWYPQERSMYHTPPVCMVHTEYTCSLRVHVLLSSGRGELNSRAESGAELLSARGHGDTYKKAVSPSVRMSFLLRQPQSYYLLVFAISSRNHVGQTGRLEKEALDEC